MSVHQAAAEGRERRGICVLELERTLLAEPSLEALARRFGLHDAMRWARSTARAAPGSIHEARNVVQGLAGVPLETARKVCSDVRFRAGAAQAVVAARSAGLEVVLLASSPRMLAQQIGQRIGVDRVAGWEPEVAYGRFSGRLEALPWEGRCGQAVCGERLLHDLRRRHGRPAVAVTAVPDPCMCGAADVAVAVGHRHGAAVMVDSIADLPALLDQRFAGLAAR